jgi:hypothetical protein
MQRCRHCRGVRGVRGACGVCGIGGVRGVALFEVLVVLAVLERVRQSYHDTIEKYFTSADRRLSSGSVLVQQIRRIRSIRSTMK